jgi:hypothetical protein
MVIYHFNDIVAGGRGYWGYRRTVANIAEARWHLQLASGCVLPNSGDRRRKTSYSLQGRGVSRRRRGDRSTLLMGVRLQAGNHGRGGCMLDGGRVRQCYAAREEMDGRNP